MIPVISTIYSIFFLLFFISFNFEIIASLAKLRTLFTALELPFPHHHLDIVRISPQKHPPPSPLCQTFFQKSRHIGHFPLRQIPLWASAQFPEKINIVFVNQAKPSLGIRFPVIAIPHMVAAIIHRIYLLEVHHPFHYLALVIHRFLLCRHYLAEYPSHRIRFPESPPWIPPRYWRTGDGTYPPDTRKLPAIPPTIPLRFWASHSRRQDPVFPIYPRPDPWHPPDFPAACSKIDRYSQLIPQ